MTYSREELDWIEAEWAFHLHGRSAFLSREDFQQLQVWDQSGVSADAVVAAMETFFARRAKRAKPRTYVALAHLERDVAKAMTLRAALRRTVPEEGNVQGWEGVKEPLASDPKARMAFEAWQRLRSQAPAPDSPGYLEHFDAERQAHRAFVALAEAALGSQAATLQGDLAARLKESGIQPETLVWKRAWEHHWNRQVCEAWGVKD